MLVYMYNARFFQGSLDFSQGRGFLLGKSQGIIFSFLGGPNMSVSQVNR